MEETLMDIALALAYINPSYTYRLVDGDIIEWRGPGEQPTQAELDAAYQAARRDILLTELDDAMHQYLIDRGYTRNEREGMQSSYTNIIEAAWAFVDENVLLYYYSKKIELENATDVDAVTWDFSSLDAQDPAVRLQEIKLLLMP